MNTCISRAALVALLALGFNGVASATDDCGINSNKPCPSQDKTSSKEPAYKSLNSNKPMAAPAGRATAPTDVQASAREDAAAKATLSGVSASDLKLKPKPPKTSSKESAGND
jgi:hypothetical protein